MSMFQQSFLGTSKPVGTFANRRAKQADLFAGLSRNPLLDGQPQREPLPGQTTFIDALAASDDSPAPAGSLPDPVASTDDDRTTDGQPAPAPQVDTPAVGDRYQSETGNVWRVVNVDANRVDVERENGPHWDTGSPYRWDVASFAGMTRLPRSLPAPRLPLGLPAPAGRPTLRTARHFDRPSLDYDRPFLEAELANALAYQAHMVEARTFYVSRGMPASLSTYAKAELHKGRSRIARLRAKLRALDTAGA